MAKAYRLAQNTQNFRNRSFQRIFNSYGLESGEIYGWRSFFAYLASRRFQYQSSFQCKYTYSYYCSMSILVLSCLFTNLLFTSTCWSQKLVKTEAGVYVNHTWLYSFLFIQCHDYLILVSTQLEVLKVHLTFFKVLTTQQNSLYLLDRLFLSMG